jgi:outer membrane protein OmpA-like peptidoglycan-associated protein
MFQSNMCKGLFSLLFFLMALPVCGQRVRDTFNIYFDLNISFLNSKMCKKIDLLIYNDKIINGSNITIVGYADYLGPENHNKDLSIQRAQSVKNYLIKYGINKNDIKLVEGRGEVVRKADRNGAGFPSDRRVDIVVNNRILKEGAAKLKPTKPKNSNEKVAISNINDMKKLRPGAVFLLQNVYFPADRHTIKPESEPTLAKLYLVLKDNPKIKISIEGHVCCIADAPDALDIDTYEPTLSVNRAKEIYNYLVKKGIDPSRLTYAGFGKQRPVVPIERTEEDAEKNRRVEIRITEN